MKPIRWDGRERTAERLLGVMPGRTISTWGGAPGYPREVFIHTRRGKQLCAVKRGQFIGTDAKGNPQVINHG